MEDLIFLPWCCWRFKSSRMLRCAVSSAVHNTSRDCSVFIFIISLSPDPEEEGCTIVWNTGKDFPSNRM